jgi:fucose 4-O-acetylase-like acetyltransferase
VTTATTTDTTLTNGSDRGQTRESRRTETPAPRRRDPFFDNAKFLLIVFVVIGHNWFPLINHSRVVRAAYIDVYSFHMPAFILLSGYFSRSFTARPDQVRKLVKSVLLPYLLFQAAYLCLVTWTDHRPFFLDLTTPVYLCWFLLALFVWRLSTPVWRALRQPVVVAVVVSVAAGLMNVTLDFALGRILQFLPFFVLGLTLRPEHFAWLRRTPVRWWAAACALLSLPTCYLLAPSFNVDWLNLEYGVNHFPGTSVPQYVLVRLALFAASAVMVGSVLALVPGRGLWFTALGALTMYPYLLHGLLVKSAERLGLHTAVWQHGPLAVVALTAGAVALPLLLTTAPVRQVTRWAVEPSRPAFLTRPRRTAPAPAND